MMNLFIIQVKLQKSLRNKAFQKYYIIKNLVPFISEGPFQCNKKMQLKHYMQEKRNNCSLPLNVYFKNKLELVKQAMLQKNALRDFTYLYITLPRFILVWSIHYNLPKRITGQPFTHMRKNCGISEINFLRLIIMCKDRTVFNW